MNLIHILLGTISRKEKHFLKRLNCLLGVLVRRFSVFLKDCRCIHYRINNAQENGHFAACSASRSSKKNGTPRWLPTVFWRGRCFCASEDSLTLTHYREEFMDALQPFWFLAVVLLQLLVVVARAIQDKPDERCMKIQSC